MKYNKQDSFLEMIRDKDAIIDDVLEDYEIHMSLNTSITGSDKIMVCIYSNLTGLSIFRDCEYKIFIRASNYNPNTFMRRLKVKCIDYIRSAESDRKKRIIELEEELKYLKSIKYEI